MSRWERWTTKPKQGMSLGSFIAEQQSPAEMAKSMGLQSDGSGGYIDPETGQIAARTVNNELVFYDPMGGAISAQSDGAELTQAQPSWRDPVTGEITVPPGQAESPEEIAAIPDIVPAKAPTGYSAFMNAKKKEMYANQEPPQQEEEEPQEEEPEMQPEMGMGEEVKTLKKMFEDLADMKKLQDKQSEIQAQPGPKDKVEAPSPSLSDHEKKMNIISNNDGLTNADKLRASHNQQDGLRRSLGQLQKTYKKEGMTLDKEVGDIQDKITTAFSGTDMSDPKTKQAYNTMGYMFSKAQFPQNRSAQLRTYTDEQLKALKKRQENGDFERIYKIDSKTGLPDIEALEEEIKNHQIFNFNAEDPVIKRMWKSLPAKFRGQFGGQGWNGIGDFVEHLNGGGRDFVTKLPLPAYRRQIDHQIPGDRAKDHTLPKEIRDYIKDKHQIRGIDFSLNQDFGEEDKIPSVKKILDKHPRMDELVDEDGMGIKTFEDSANIANNTVAKSYRPLLADLISDVDEEGKRTLKDGVDIGAMNEFAKQMGYHERDMMKHLLDHNYNIENLPEEDREKAQQIKDQVSTTFDKIADTKGSIDIFRALDTPTTLFGDPNHGGAIPAEDTIMDSFVDDLLLQSDPTEQKRLLESWTGSLREINRDAAEAWNSADREGKSKSEVKALEKVLSQNANKNILKKMKDNNLFDLDKITNRHQELISQVAELRNSENYDPNNEDYKEKKRKRDRLKSHIKRINQSINEDIDIEMDDEPYVDEHSYADVAEMLQELLFYFDKGKKKPAGKNLKFEDFRAKIEE